MSYGEHLNKAHLKVYIQYIVKLTIRAPLLFVVIKIRSPYNRDSWYVDNV